MNLQIYENERFGKIRTTLIDGVPWFVGKDVAKALGYKDVQSAVHDHVDPDDKGVGKTPTPGGKQTMTVINESGLYSLILSSKLPGAKEFKRWVTSEVLPTIRETGRYELEARQPAPDSTVLPSLLPDSKDYLTAARLVAHCPKERLPMVMHLLKAGGFDVIQKDGTPIAYHVKSTADTSDRIREACRQTGLRQSHIASMLGYDKGTFNNWYRKANFPREETYQILCQQLDALVATYERG